MKKLAYILVIMLVITIPLQAFAASKITPGITFSGTSAECSAVVVGDNSSQHLEVTMKLMYRNYIQESWSCEGYGYVSMNHTATVVSGRTYRLLVEVIAKEQIVDNRSINRYNDKRRYHHSETHSFDMIGGIFHDATTYSPNYYNSTARKNRAIDGYLIGTTFYDCTGNIYFYLVSPNGDINFGHNAEPLFVHEESSAYLLPYIQEE